MMWLRSARRALLFATQNAWRNGWLSLATILIFILTLFSVHTLFALRLISAGAVERVEDSIDVSVYFKAATPEKTIVGLRDYLLTLSQVEGVDAVHAEDALARFRERHANDTELLSALTAVDGNPFGGELIIRARTTEDFPFILEALNHPTFSAAIKEKDFSDHQRLIERLQRIADMVRKIALVFTMLFSLIATLIVFNTVRVAIYTHREEIAIMKLVGAGNTFVRAPFVLEALCFTGIATAISAAITLPLLGVVEAPLDRFIGGDGVNLVGNYLAHGWLYLVLPGVILGVVSIASSLMAMRKYLRV